MVKHQGLCSWVFGMFIICLLFSPHSGNLLSTLAVEGLRCLRVLVYLIMMNHSIIMWSQSIPLFCFWCNLDNLTDGNKGIFWYKLNHWNSALDVFFLRPGMFLLHYPTLSLWTTALSHINSLNNKSCSLCWDGFWGIKNTPAFTPGGSFSPHVSFINLLYSHESLKEFPTSWLIKLLATVCLCGLVYFLRTCPTAPNQSLSFFPLSRRSWLIFWRSVTWYLPAFSAWRCCWS